MTIALPSVVADYLAAVNAFNVDGMVDQSYLPR